MPLCTFYSHSSWCHFINNLSYFPTAIIWALLRWALLCFGKLGSSFPPKPTFWTSLSGLWIAESLLSAPHSIYLETSSATVALWNSFGTWVNVTSDDLCFAWCVLIMNLCCRSYSTLWNSACWLPWLLVCQTAASYYITKCAWPPKKLCKWFIYYYIMIQ